MDKEPILALFNKRIPEAAKEAIGALHYDAAFDNFEAGFNAAIESYKAELLKEVGEPVGYLHQWIEYHSYGDTVAGEPCSAITNDGKPFDKSDTVTMLFTSDQVAAAIINATKPLIEERDRAVKRMEAGWIEVCDSGILAFKEMNDELRAKLAAAQEELRSRDDFIAMLQETQKDQLAKAEQRVAEACALQVATETRFHWLDAARVAKEIRSGEWRKFVKEV